MMMKVKLLVDHVHGDIEYKADAVIDVDESSAQWLIANGHAIQYAPPRKPMPTKPTVTEEI